MFYLIHRPLSFTESLFSQQYNNQHIKKQLSTSYGRYIRNSADLVYNFERYILIFSPDFYRFSVLNTAPPRRVS